MKKIIYIILGILALAFAGVVYAAPIIQNFTNIAPFVDNTYDNGTSTQAWKNLFTYNLKISTTTTGCVQGTQTGSFVTLFLTGTNCGSGGAGTNFFTSSSSPLYTYLNTGTYLQAPAIIATSTTATSTIANFAGVLDASSFSGVDMCAKINAAYLALPSNGGKITVPTGRYDCTTPVVFGTANKVVILSGAGHGGPIGPYPVQIGGTTLYYSPSTGAAITVNTNYSNAQSVIENISIQGSNGTTARTSKGVVFGGANGAFQGTLRDSHVSGFGYGVYYDSYTSFNVIDNSTIDFNGKNIYEPDTAGANGENMRVSNSTIADSNNQTGGATSLYCIEVQESGNVQWNFINTSIDDCSFYSNQFGGTGNINTFTNVHWENPNETDYYYIQTLSNVDGVVTNLIGGDMMSDTTTGMNSFILNGGHVNIQGTAFTTNFPVSVPTTRVVTNQNTSAVNTVSWSGAQETNAGVTYIYGTVPFSPQGYGTGLSIGPSFTVNLPTSTQNGTTTIANLGGVLDASTFSGTDMCQKINNAYTSLPTKGGIINVPRGYFECAVMINMSTNGKRALLQGAPAGGTEIRWNGVATSTKINWGIQGSGIDHTSGCGIKNITFKGSSYATSTSPQTGIDIGGSNGSDCTVFENVNIQEFGRGLWTGANVYHFAWYNGIIRANGMNVFIDTANNSGESMDFFNPFIIDGYATYGEEADDCFVLSDYAASSVSIFGGSINSCQLKIGVQVLSVNLVGVHMENPSPDWPKYTWIEVGDSAYTQLNILGGTWVQNEVALRPDQFILSNGAGVYVSGLTIFPTDGVSGTVTNLIVGGHAVWNGLNNTIGGVTNVVSVSPFLFPFTRSGSTANDIVNFGKLGIGTSTPGALLGIENTGTTLGFVVSDVLNDTTPFAIDAAGNVGIGTSAPTNKLTIKSSGTSSNPFEVFNSANAFTLLRLRESSGGNGEFSVFDVAGNANVIVRASGVTQFDGGNVGIGTTTAYAKLVVASHQNGLGPQFVVASSSTAVATSTAFIINQAGNVGVASTSPWRTLSVTGTMAVNGLTSATGGTMVCIQSGKEFTDSGSATNCATSALVTKDITGKITPEVAWYIVNRMNAVTFKYKGENIEQHPGFIADEVAIIDQEIHDKFGVDFHIAEYSNEDKEVTLTDGSTHFFKKGDPYSVNYQMYTAVLTVALQNSEKNLETPQASNSNQVTVLWYAFGLLFIIVGYQGYRKK